MPRTPPTSWGALFNFAGGGLVHMELFLEFIVSLDNPTLFEAIARYLIGYGTHALRPSAANVPLNGVYYETDTTNLFQNQAGTWVQIASIGGGTATLHFEPPVGLRLSLTTNTYVTTSDVTAAGTLYWTTVLSGGTGVVTGYNGSALARKTVQQKSLSLTLTSGKNYDVFYDYDGDALALSAAWTDDTTRADALADEQGAIVLASDHTKLWLGTIRASGTNTTEDSGGGVTSQVGGKRFVYNAYNQVPRNIKVIDTTNAWAYRTATWRQENGAAGNKTEYVTGDSATQIEATYLQTVALLTNTGRAAVGIGLNSTTVPSGLCQGGYSAAVGVYIISPISAKYVGTVRLGYSAINALEFGATDAGSGDCQFTGDNGTDQQTGLIVTLWN